MADDDIVKALRAIEDGLVRHCFPFTWERAEDALHIDPRTLQRALQLDLISVEANADRASRPVCLTASGRCRLSRERD
jgi:hypothetical protein